MKKIGKVDKGIIDDKFDDRMIEELNNKFLDLMREHNIKYGTKTKHGVLAANHEWTMCLALYLDCLRGAIELEILFEVPDDLQHY